MSVNAPIIMSSRQAMEQAGLSFDGAEWAAVLPAAIAPQPAFAVATDQQTIDEAAGRIGLGFAQFVVDRVPVLLGEVLLPDADVQIAVALPVCFDPTDRATRKRLGQLAQQETLTFHYFDKDSGGPLAGRAMRFDADVKADLRGALDATEGWQPSDRTAYSLAAHAVLAGR